MPEDSHFSSLISGILSSGGPPERQFWRPLTRKGQLVGCCALAELQAMSTLESAAGLLLGMLLPSCAWS